MATWNLTENIDAQTSTPTLTHNANGDCFITVGTASRPIYAVWIEVDATSTESQVQIVFQPQTGVGLIDEAEVDTVLVPPTHGGAATWNPVVSGVTTTRTIDFDVPTTSGTTWGWDFLPGNYPPPLKMKVRVKRL